MKQLLLLFLLITVSQAYSQDKISKKHTVTLREDIDFERMYNAESGKKMTKDEVLLFLNENKDFKIEKQINEQGQVEKYFLSKSEPSINPNGVTNTVSLEVGQPFLPLQLQTVTGERIDFADLNDKTIILRFEIEATSFRFKKHEIKVIDEKITQSNHSENIVAIAIFTSSIDDVLTGFDLPNTNFKKVAQSGDIASKLKIRNFPSTYIIKNGILSEIIEDVDDIDFSK